MNKQETHNMLVPGMNELSVFGEKITISPECIEYGRLQRKFDVLADEQARAAAADIARVAEDVDEFCRTGNRWAHRFIDKTSDIAAEEMIASGVYDFDRATFVEKFLDASPWEKPFAEFVSRIAAVDVEEGNREAERQIKSEIADSDGLGERAWQGLKNMGGRAVFAIANASEKSGIFKEYSDRLVNGIYRTIKLSIDEVSACLAAAGHPLNIQGGIDSCEKATRLFNNLKDGKIPATAVNSVKAQILALNPYDADFYEWVYINDGDASGELTAAADRFGVSLKGVKAKAFKTQLGECGFKSIEETQAYREKAVRLGEELRYDPKDTLVKIDSEMVRVRANVFKEQLGECEFKNIEEAQAYREKAVRLGEELRHDPKDTLAKIDAELKRIEELGRTTFGVVYPTVEEAVSARGSREAFLKGIEKAVAESGVADLYTATTAPHKKLVNARAAFPIPEGETIYALNDTTVFGSCKTGLAVTGWGLRWRNDSAHPTHVVSMPWETYAKIQDMPKAKDDVITFAPGAVFCNTGSNVAPMKIFWLIRDLWEWCRTATFFGEVPPDEAVQSKQTAPVEVQSTSAEIKPVAQRDTASVSQGIVHDALSAWKTCMRKYADFSGRAGMKEYWMFLAVNVVATMVLGAISAGILGMVYVLVTVVPMFSAMARRFHDQGRSGWMCLAGLIPIVGQILVFILLLQPGEVTENQYGPVPDGI